MGTSRSFAEFGQKVDRLQRGVSDLPSTQTKRVVQVAKAAYRASAPERLRGVGKRGAKLGVRDNTSRFPDGAKALIFAIGPWQLIEGDTKAHRIPRSRGARARRRVVVIPGVGVRAYANHPGTKGKHPWAKTTDKLKPALPRLYVAALGDELRRIF